MSGATGKGAPYGVFEDVYVPQGDVDQWPSSTTGAVSPWKPRTTPPYPATCRNPRSEPLSAGPTTRAPRGLLAGARSGDKGGDANVGVWVRSDDAWRWLAHELTVERFRQLIPEAAALPVTRHVLPACAP
ncbi:hypothetical protein GCM10023238_40560 [Streptomyces heliomycini]